MRAVFFTLLLLCGCSRSEQLSEQPSVAASQVRAWVPVGTTATEASRIMQAHHFNCSAMTNGSFGPLKQIDYLYCDYRQRGTVQRRWQAALVLTNGKVADVQVTTGLIGP